MNPYRKAAQFLLRMVATGLILTGLLMVSAPAFEWLMKRPVTTAGWLIALQVLLLVAGVILLIRSGKIARRLTEDYDEE